MDPPGGDRMTPFDVDYDDDPGTPVRPWFLLVIIGALTLVVGVVTRNPVAAAMAVVLAALGWWLARR